MIWPFNRKKPRDPATIVSGVKVSEQAMLKHNINMIEFGIWLAQTKGVTIDAMTISQQHKAFDYWWNGELGQTLRHEAKGG